MLHCCLRATLDPMKRFQKYMISQGWWDEAQDVKLLDEERMAVLKALETAENRGPPSISELFNDVYDVPTANLKRQEKELHAHMAKYPGHYNNAGGH